MQSPFSLLPSFLVPLLAGACHNPSSAPTPADSAPVVLPQSALAALVRSLETVDALRPEGVAIQVRAIECDSLVDRSQPAEFVRVLLHVTVYAQAVARARVAFEELQRALEAEARSRTREEAPTAERIRRVFADMDWQPALGAEPLVSFSNAIRIEVAPGREAPASAEREYLGAQPSEPASRYLEEVAEAHGMEVRPIVARVSEPVPHRRDLRCLFRPAQGDAHFTRVEIAEFLRVLEAGSPAARVTHVRIERASTLADPFGPDGWTFEAELTVRVAVP